VVASLQPEAGKCQAWVKVTSSDKWPDIMRNVMQLKGNTFADVFRQREKFSTFKNNGKIICNK
jgi:hypothetical protein